MTSTHRVDMKRIVVAMDVTYILSYTIATQYLQMFFFFQLNGKC